MPTAFQQPHSRYFPWDWLVIIYGTDSALLYESLENLDRTDELSKWSGKVSFWGQITEGSCALSAGLLYAIDPYLPFVIQAFLSLGNLILQYSLLNQCDKNLSVRTNSGKWLIYLS